MKDLPPHAAKDPLFKPLALGLMALGTAMSALLINPELPVVGTKLAYADIPLAAVIFLTLLNMAAGRMPMTHLVRPQIVVASLLVVFILTGSISYAFVSIPRNIAADGGAILLANYLYGFLMFLAGLYWIRSLADAEKVVLGWLFGACIVALVAAWALFGHAPGWAYDGRRISSTMKNVNQMQSYLAPAFAFACTYLISRRSTSLFKGGCFALLAAITLAMASTGSRSSVLLGGILLVIALMRVLLSPRIGSLFKLAVGIAVTTAFLASLLLVNAVLTHGPQVLPDGPLRSLARPVVEFSKMGEEARLVDKLGPRGEQIVIVSQNWYRSPVFGFGPGSFRDRFNHRHEVHNTYLGTLMDQGVLGLSLIIIVFSILAYCVYQRMRASENEEFRLLLSSLLISLLMIYLYGAFTFGLRQRPFWILLGVCCAAIGVASSRASLSKSNYQRVGMARWRDR